MVLSMPVLTSSRRVTSSLLPPPANGFLWIPRKKSMHGRVMSMTPEEWKSMAPGKMTMAPEEWKSMAPEERKSMAPGKKTMAPEEEKKGTLQIVIGILGRLLPFVGRAIVLYFTFVSKLGICLVAFVLVMIFLIKL